MSDFIADLESELRSAARRRAGRRRPVLPRRAALVLAAALVALVVAAGAVRLLPGGSEPAGGPAPGGGVSVPLPATVPVAGCDDGTAGLKSKVPEPLAELLGVLRRPQTEPDGLPALDGADEGWVPLGGWSSAGVRRPGLGRLQHEVHLVPGVVPDTDAARRCSALRNGRLPAGEPGLCLIDGHAGEPLRVACFTPPQIRDGAAIALLNDGSVYGVVGDGVEAVELTAGGRTVRAAVTENAYEATLPGARRGTPVTVRQIGAGGCRPAVDPELLRTVPVLRRPPDAGASVPEPVLDAVPRGLESAARIAGGGDEVTYWVLPFESADPGAAACGIADRACVVPIRDGERAGAPLCADAREIARRGAFLAGPLGDRVVVYGLTRDGVERLGVDIDNEPAGGVDVIDGVAAGLLPERVRWRDGADVRFVLEPVERDPGVLALLNGTTEKGLAGEAQGELVERVPELLPAGGTTVANTTSQQVERSEVLHLAGREAAAYPIGAALGITRVREVTREELDDAGAPGSATIAVIVGRDLRMR